MGYGANPVVRKCQIYSMSSSKVGGKRVPMSYSEQSLLYASVSCTIGKFVKNYLETVFMWFYRKMLRIPWTDTKRNEDVLKATNSQRELNMKILFLTVFMWSVSEAMYFRGPIISPCTILTEFLFTSFILNSHRFGSTLSREHSVLRRIYSNQFHLRLSARRI